MTLGAGLSTWPDFPHSNVLLPLCVSIISYAKWDMTLSLLDMLVGKCVDMLSCWELVKKFNTTPRLDTRAIASLA